MSKFDDFIGAVESQLDDLTVLFVVGEYNQGKNTQRRRVHWYRTGGPIRESERKGGVVIDGERVEYFKIRLEKYIATIYAEDDDTVELLLDNLIVAVDEVATAGAVEFEEFTWDDSRVNQRTPVSGVVFTAKVPVVKRNLPLTIVTDTSHTCTIDTEL